MNQKELTIQEALGTMNKMDRFVEHIKQAVTPVPYPSYEELCKPFPDLDAWILEVDSRFGKVIEQFRVHFEEELQSKTFEAEIGFVVNTTFSEDWSSINWIDLNGVEHCGLERIYAHLQIIAPLMIITAIQQGSGQLHHITINADS